MQNSGGFEAFITGIVVTVIGVAWIVVFSVSEATAPIGGLGSWNIVVGVGLVMIGAVVAAIAGIILLIDRSRSPLPR